MYHGYIPNVGVNEKCKVRDRVLSLADIRDRCTIVEAAQFKSRCRSRYSLQPLQPVVARDLDHPPPCSCREHCAAGNLLVATF
jgi:hypothetical protein